MKRIHIQIYIVAILALVSFVSGFLLFFFVPNVTQERIQDIEHKCAAKSPAQSVSCFRREFQRIVRTKNLQQVVDSITAVDAKNPSILFESGLDCHGLTHIIGDIVGRLPDARASMLIPACGSSCGYGCTHGVVMGIMKHDPNRINHLESLCQSPDALPLSVYDEIACFHGIGHGLAEYTRYNVSAAVTRCNMFGTRDAKEECMSGVFMEVYSPADKNHESVPIPKDLFSDCVGLHDTSLVYCQRMVITSLYRSNKEISTPFRLCHEVVPQKEGECVHTLGADAYFVEQQNITNILNLCRLSGPFYESCVEGVVSSSLTIHQNDRQAKEICNAAGSAVQQQCAAYTDRRLQVLKKTNR